MQFAGFAAAAAALFAFASISAMAQPALTPVEEARVRALVREVLAANPELVEEALLEAQAKRTARAAAALAADPRHFSVGPKNAAVTIVEFFDYQCGYCRAATPWVTAQTKRKDARVVFVEYPVVGGAGSEEAARAALASIRQGKYLPFHQALMAHRGAFDSNAVNAVAKRAGLDVPRLRKDMYDSAVDQLLRANLERGSALGVTGTPAFFINGEFTSGYDRERLAALTKTGPKTQAVR